MLPIDKLSVNVPGLTSEMGEELEERVRDFENIHEESASVGGAGYVPTQIGRASCRERV